MEALYDFREESIKHREIKLHIKSRPITQNKKASVFWVFYQEEVNPLTGIKELLSNEDMMPLALIHKTKKGDVYAYKALMDSIYGAVKQSLELTEAETPIFNQLDIDVID